MTRSAAVAALAALAAAVAIACTGSDPTPPAATAPSVAQEQSEDTAPSSAATAPSATQEQRSEDQAQTVAAPPEQQASAAYIAVSAGYEYTCAIRESDGAIECWGDDYRGRTDAPASAYSAVSAGRYHICAIRESDGAIVCWGENEYRKATPQPGAFRAVSAGDHYTCAIREGDGAIECWGWHHRPLPAGAFRTVSAGINYEWSDINCAIREDKTLACWGGNENGQTEQRDFPAGEFAAVSIGSTLACGLRENGEIVCWRDEANIGYEENDAPAGAFRAVSVSMGGSYACAIRESDGAIECWTVSVWADNDSGLIDAPAGAFRAVSVGSSHACAIRSEDSAIECWGSNYSGQATPPPDSEFRAGAAAQMTIDEYASWCNEARYGAVTPDTTWAEAADLLTETITEFERVAERLPPEQGLAEYHEVMTDALRIMQSAARMDDIAGSVADLFNRDLLNLFNIPEMFVLAVRVGIALEGLTPSTRAKLGGGCI